MAQLREGSVIKKPTGDEVIATVNDIGEIVEEIESNKITIGTTQPTSGWWFEEI